MGAMALDFFEVFREMLTEQRAKEVARKLDALVEERVEDIVDRKAAAVQARMEAKAAEALDGKTKDLATKGDLHALDARISALDAKLDTRIGEAKHDILKWMVTGFLTIVLAIIALMAMVALGGPDPSPPPSLLSP